jgi:uncharacterized protein (DUF362 family)
VVLIAAAGSISFILHDTKGPGPNLGEQKTISLPDFSLPNTQPRMAIVHGPDRAATITKAFKSLGGIETFVGDGDCVLLKVNAAFATPASLSATTHPDLIKEVITLCYKAGAREVRVSDNPINDPESCFKLTGIGKATESAGGKLILPRENFFEPYSLDGGSLIQNWPTLYGPLEGVTKLIGIAPLKDHHRSGASMTMKNWYGLLGGRRNIFHQDINNIIKELAMMVHPTLVILDGTTTMMTNGPTGGALSDLKSTNTMIVSTDQVAADAFGSTLLERNISDLPYIAKAEAAGCGTADYETLKPIRIT